MSGLWVAENPEIGMFVLAYIQIKSVRHLDGHTNGTRERDGYRGERTTDEIQMRQGNREQRQRDTQID